jgi:iron complex outermembrane receptor protein
VNENLTDGRAEGLEALVSFTPVAFWRLSGSYSYLRLKLDPKGLDLNRGTFLEGATPRHQVGLRSDLDLPRDFEFDVSLRRVSAVRQDPQIVTGEGIAAYSELDVRVAWRRWKRTEVSLVGQNLLHARHPEFGAPASRGEVERSVFGKIIWEF